MKVLVTGASGLLGAHLTAGLRGLHDTVGIDRHEWWDPEPARLLCGDLGSDSFVASAMGEARPHVIVHCAAMVNVDDCERNPEAAFAHNAELTRRIARAAPPGCLFVYITTDGIFPGDHPFAEESETPAPRTVYGRSKLQGEREVAEATENHLIIRTNFYGWSSGRKPTSAEWLYSALQNSVPITAFDDFFFTPIYVVDLVAKLKRLIESQHRGLFHVCGAERVSKYDFAVAMADLAGFSTRAVRRGSIDNAGLVAPRPKDMSLSCERYRSVTRDALPDCRSGLNRFLEQRDKRLSERFSEEHANPRP